MEIDVPKVVVMWFWFCRPWLCKCFFLHAHVSDIVSAPLLYNALRCILYATKFISCTCKSHVPNVNTPFGFSLCPQPWIPSWSHQAGRRWSAESAERTCNPSHTWAYPEESSLPLRIQKIHPNQWTQLKNQDPIVYKIPIMGNCWQKSPPFHLQNPTHSWKSRPCSLQNSNLRNLLEKSPPFHLQNPNHSWKSSPFNLQNPNHRNLLEQSPTFHLQNPNHGKLLAKSPPFNLQNPNQGKPLTIHLFCRPDVVDKRVKGTQTGRVMCPDFVVVCPPPLWIL